ncbi:recombinase family protein [Armatimonas rosea]|uniref:recombinase family protein n=1 Tax=Armatimonas rosea TaxID=685828 RepID=UPI0016206B55
MGTIIGYARTAIETRTSPSNGSRLDRQKVALVEAGCDVVFGEICSGMAHLEECPVLMGLLQELNFGDTLVVCDLTRLSRSVAVLCSILSDLQERGIEVRVLGELPEVIPPAFLLSESLESLRDIALIRGDTTPLKPARRAVAHATRLAVVHTKSVRGVRD